VVLETTLATEYAPGTNRIATPVGANWTFLLPSLSVGHTLCIGRPRCSTLHRLLEISECLTLTHHPLDSGVVEEEPHFALSDLEVHGAIRFSRFNDLPKHAFDLVVVCDRRLWRRVRRVGVGRNDMLRLLTPGGVAYQEFIGLRRAPVRGALHAGNEDESAIVLRLWTAPLSGEAQAFAPLHDKEMAGRLLRHSGYSETFHERMVQRVHRSVLNRGGVRGRAGRFVALTSPFGSDLSYGPPMYVRNVAGSCGIDISRHRWGLWAAGKFQSKKVIFFLADSHEQSPQIIVKLPRHADMSYRIENAERALTELRTRQLFPDRALPDLVFSGQHAGLAIVGERAIQGESFEKRALSGDEHAWLRSVLDELTRLGAMSRQVDVTSGNPFAEAMRGVHDRFSRIYRLSADHAEFLARQVDDLANHSGAPPIVFQHGDCGTWNIMVTSDDRIAFLDWEAAERRGVPLWDLFYFVQTFTHLVGSSRGVYDPISNFDSQFLRLTSMAGVVINAVRKYVNEVGLNAELVEPLFYTCWMHRALKESTRLDPARLDTGSYVRLLRHCIGQRQHDSLASMFTADR
jgi:hypothetical protein